MLRDRDRISPLLKGVFARLAPNGGEKKTFTGSVWNKAASAFQDTEVPVFTDIPKDLAFPFVAVGINEVKPWGSKTRPGNEVILSLLIASDYPGPKEASGLASKCIDTLTRQALDLSQQDVLVVGFYPAPGMVGVLEDGRTQFRRVNFRVQLVDADGEQDPISGG